MIAQTTQVLLNLDRCNKDLQYIFMLLKGNKTDFRLKENAT